jgi:hypothetical protein
MEAVAEVELRIGVALLRCSGPPLDRFEVVFLHAMALLRHEAQLKK